MKKLAQLRFGTRQRFAAGGRGAILAPKAPAGTLLRRTQEAFFLHAAQHGIERAGAEPVAVSAQFLDHPVADQRFPGSMMQDVQPNKTRKPILITIFSIDFRCCHSMSNFNIE
jgi:hypothetical protein